MFIPRPEGGLSLDTVDRELLNIVQSRFPVESRPYLNLGEEVGITEMEAYQCVQEMRAQGYIRRLGGILDSHRLGYYSTLCAAKVPEEKIPVLTEILAGITGVTHNYLRAHTYNMWFTLIAPSYPEVEEILNRVKTQSGVEEIYSLPALRLYKINVDFDFNTNNKIPDNEDHTSDNLNSRHQNMKQRGADSLLKQPYAVSEEEIALIRLLQEDLPDGLNPFRTLATELGWEENMVLEYTHRLLEEGVIRRLGAVLRHQKAGFVANAMGVWQVESERAAEVGPLMASFREVSHCYERPTLPDWPYNLFPMVHGHSEQECRQVIAKIAHTTGITKYDALYSLLELKKSSMKYFV